MTTREINTGVVTAISDTDLVTVCDAGGALRPISFANLARLVRNSIQSSSRNLASLGYSSAYDDSSYDVGIRTFPLNINMPTDPYPLKAGENYSVHVDDVEVLTGPFSHLLFSIGGVDKKTLTKDSNGWSAVVTIPSDASIRQAYLYPVNKDGKTGGIKCNVLGLTLVKGNIPMCGWLPSPQNSWGG